MNTIGKTSVALLSGVLMSLPAFLLGDVSENQIIYVNLPKLMEESFSGQAARATLENSQASKATDINDINKSWENAKSTLEKTKKDFVAKRSTLSADAIKKEKNC
jgi:Skp family chaperone for outer membrane proteins